MSILESSEIDIEHEFIKYTGGTPDTLPSFWGVWKRAWELSQRKTAIECADLCNEIEDRKEAERIGIDSYIYQSIDSKFDLGFFRTRL